MYETQRSGDLERAVRLVNAVARPLIGEITDVSTAAALKRLVAAAGYDVGPPFPHISELNERERDSLRDCYEAIVVRTS